MRLPSRATPWPLVLVAALGGFGGLCGPPDPDPCESDPLGCSVGDDFRLDPRCTLEGALDVALGHGESSFTALPAGDEPVVHYGLQGGQHVFLAVRVANYADDYPALEVSLRAETFEEECTGAGECGVWQVVGDRLAVVDRRHTGSAPGLAEVAGLRLVLDWWPEDMQRRFTLAVRDPCNRSGRVVHEVPKTAR